MTTTPRGGRERALAHLRRWWHVHLAALTILGLLAAFGAGVFAGSQFRMVFGVKLDKQGQRIYRQVARRGLEQGMGSEHEQLPLAAAAKLAASAKRAERLLSRYPHPLATPQPSVLVETIPRNFSSRNGAHPLLLVAHDTESPNAPGLADLEAIRAWFSNPSAQASANYVDDADGNVLELVPDAEKAWHVAYFNPWAIGVEQVGYASQHAWPLAQLEATARIFAREAAKYGIPIQRGAVAGCTIVRPGIVEHNDLGLCGGGHHDPGPAYPIGKLIALVQMYASAAERPPAKPTWFRRAAKLPPMWAWFAWRDHHHPARLRPRQIPKKVPASWWPRYATHEGVA